MRLEVSEALTGAPLRTLTSLVAGQPFNVRVTALDENNLPVTNYNRNVLLVLHAEFGQETEIPVLGSLFVDGVADGIEVTPSHAMTRRWEFDINARTTESALGEVFADAQSSGPYYPRGARFSATDGNIATDDASKLRSDSREGETPEVAAYRGFFDIGPYRFGVTHAGNYDSLTSHQLTAGRSYPARVTAYNYDGTVASGYRGPVSIGNPPVSSLNALVLTNGGFGYPIPPTVVINGDGTGATAEAVVDEAGVITSITVTNPGSGYTTEPTVTIIGWGGTGAVVDADIDTGSGTVTAINVTDGGENYNSPPIVSITGGGGSGATGTATVSGPGRVVAVRVLTAGRNYSDEPGVELQGGGPDASGATAEAVVENGVITAITITNPGVNYTEPPTVIITDEGDNPGTGATAVAFIGGSITDIQLTDPGSGYLTSPTVSIEAPINGAFSRRATASIETSRGSGIVLGSVKVHDGGSGYDPLSPPLVELVGGDGSGAEAIAVVDEDGSISEIVLTSAGTGYTTVPSVVITDAAGTGAVATVQLGLAVEQWTGYITSGGVVDFDMTASINRAYLLQLRMGAPDIGLVYDATDGLTYTEGASDSYDVIAAGGGGFLTLDNIAFTTGGDAAGRVSRLRYRLTNPLDVPVRGPFDTHFTLTDSDNLVLLEWTERSVGPDGVIADGGNSGNLFTTFMMPYNMPVGAYSITIQPGYSDANAASIAVNLNNPPDLFIEDFNYAPGEYRGGDAFRFDLTWTNYAYVLPGSAMTSAVPADQDYMIEVHLSANPTYGDEDDFLVWQETVFGNGNHPSNLNIANGNNWDEFANARVQDEALIGMLLGQANRGILLPTGMLLPDSAVTITRYATLPEGFAGTYYLLARINSSGGRDGTGFTPENIPQVLMSGNNTVFAQESQKITILPKQSTDTFRISLANEATGEGEEASFQSTGQSDNATISSDGQYVAFESLGQLDTNPVQAGITNIYLRNVEGGTTVLLTGGIAASAANGHSANPEISANGRYVVFQSAARNLVPGDSNGVTDIFVRDVEAGITRRLSVNPLTSAQANNGSQLPSISGSGRYVVFESRATNLVSGPSTGVSQIYLYDRDTDADGLFDESGQTSVRLISAVGGVPGTMASTQPRISSDSNYVVFITRAPSLLGQSAPFTQIIRWNRLTDTFTVVTRSLETPSDLADNESAYPAINADGSYIAFASRSHNLTDDAYYTGLPHVFRARFDGETVTEIIRLNSRRSVVAEEQEPDDPAIVFAPDMGGFEPTISGDGHLVAFASESRDLLPPLPVKSVDRTLIQNRFVYNYFDNNSVADVYVYDFADRDSDRDANPDPDAVLADPIINRASVSRFGYEANSWTTESALVNMYRPVSRRPIISGDGRYVAFTSDAKGHSGIIFGETNFDYTATNEVRDIYIYDRKAGLPVFTSPPEVSLLTPAFTTLSVGQVFTFVADASSPARPIASVEFYANNSLIGTATAPSSEDVTRYSVTWTAPSPGSGNTTSRQYEISAIAVDANGLRSALSNIVNVYVSQIVGVAPTATITNPVATTTGEGDTAVTTPAVLPVGSAVPIVIRVVQGNSSIASVNVYASSQATGSVLLGAASALGDGIYQLAYTNSLAVGTYSLVAVVEDLAGNTVTSPAVALNVTTVSTGAPSITLATPFPSAILQGQSTLLNATASAAFGRSVSRVEFFSNGVSVGTATQSPYVLSYTPTSTGTFSIIAVVTDSSNATAISGAQSVTVTSVVGSAPTVVLTATDQLTLGIGSRVTFAAKVTAGNSSIVSVRFYANSTLLGTGTLIDGSTTYQLTYVNGLPTGSYNVYAEATDANGNIVQSASRSVTSIAVEPPSVRIVTPIAGTYNILDNSAFERASARVNTQVTNDVFFGDKTITDIVVTEAGLNYAAGVVAYIEVRNDPAFGGGVSRTEPLEVTLAEDGSITALEFANEGDGAARLFFYQSAVVVIEDNFDLESIAIVAAPSSSSSIQELRYYANGVLIGSLSNAPYSLDWRPSRAGTYVLQVEITDEDGLTSSSPTVTVVINPAEDIAEPEILAAIEAAYQSILDRTPTTTEVRAYVERFGDNLTAGAVAASLLQSAEYRDDNAELILIYLAVWGEYPDISQFETLRAQRELALTDVQVVDAILASVSYTQRFGAIADLSDTLIPEQYKKIRAFALRTYKNMYGKDATGATANVVAQQFFTDIVTNALTPGQAVVNFVNENFNGGKNGTLLTRLRIAGAILLIGRVEPTPALITTLSPVPLAVIADFYFNDGEAVAAGTMIALETASGDEEAGTTFHASGLPKGLVMDVNTGVISGRIPGTLKAYVFTYWTQLNGVRSASRSVMVLVEALPTPLVGKYEALLEDSLGLPAGKISVTVAKTASLSGVVYYGDGKNYSFSGVLRVFDDGSASGVNSVGNPIVIKRKSPLLPISPALSFDAEGLLTVAIAEQISVTEDGDPVFGEVLSTGTALRPFTFTKSAPAPWRGAKKINLLNASFPETDGIAGSGTFTVASTGVLSVKAKGTDKAVLTGSAPSALDSNSVLYIRPYSKMTSGYFAGWFKAASEESIANASYPTDENEIYWFRPAGGTGTYSEGFGPLSIEVELAP